MSAMVNITSAQHLPASTTALAPTSARLGLRSDEKWLIGILVPVGIFIITCIGAVLRKCWKKYCSQTDFQRLPQTEQHVSGSGNTPINISTGPINIYQSQALNIQIFVLRNETIDGPLTDHLLKGLMTYVYDKAGHLFKTFGELLHVTSDSVVFVVRISSCASLEKLWTMYTSGELAKKLTEIFITDEVTTEDKTDLSIQVTIQESDYVRACRFFKELERASYEDLTHQLSGDMLENQPSTPQQPTTHGAVSHPLTPDLKCSTSDVQSQDFYKKEEMRGNVKTYYSDEPDKAKGLLEKIESSDNLSTLAESPVLLPLMCSLWREDSTLPETMSRLYQRVIKYMGRKEDVSKEEMSRVLIALGKVGLCGLLSPDQELTFKESDFEQSVLDIALKVGILTRQRVCKRLKPYSVVQFIHKTFQEFSAAAYLQEMLQANTEEFHDTLNEIMSEDLLDFEYLLRFCCGDNEACTLEILKVFQERHQRDLSFDSEVGQLALHCYFEGQCKCLPREEFIDSFLTDHTVIGNLNNDSDNSVTYFVQCIAEQIKDSGNADLAKVKSVDISSEYVHVSRTVEAFSGLPNLVTWSLSGNNLGGTAALWCKQLGQCKALQDLDLSECELNGQDMVHVAESLCGLPNLFTLNFSGSDLGGTVALWCKQLGQFKALKKLDLSGCKLNGQDMVHVAKSLNDLPNLVMLNLSHNSLYDTAASLDLSSCSLNGQGMVHVAESLTVLPDMVTLNDFLNYQAGEAASWCKHVGRCQALQHLDLSHCSLNRQDMVHVADFFNGLPNLVTLNLSFNVLVGTASSWCKQVGQCKALQHLDLSRCLMHGQDMAEVAESLCGLPNLGKLNVRGNVLHDTAALWCKQVGQCKALRDLDFNCSGLNGQDMVHVAESLSGLPNLVTLNLSDHDLGGTAALWCKQLGQCRALQHLNLSGSKLNGQDMVHVAESLSGLPNLVRLDLSWNRLCDMAAILDKQLGQCKALQHLDLSNCSLNGHGMVHVAESLGGLPNLVTLSLSWNDLSGTAALWCKQLGQCKALQDLDLSLCFVNGQDMVHVGEFLCGLPNLITLSLSGNHNLSGTAVSWGKQLGQCKALQDLDLRNCALNGQDMVHVAESLSGLPNLVRLDLSDNRVLDSSASILIRAEMKKFKALQELKLGPIVQTDG